MASSLDGRLVLDLSRYLPGQYCSMILADHGARVIAVEDRRFENERLPFLHHLLRNKEHMTLNLKKEKGLEVFFALAERADVVLEGFRPGVVDRLGIGFSQIRKINPRIVYCSLTGYGQTGPRKNKAGHDLNFVGDSGVLSLIGLKNAPPAIPGVQLADLSGGLHAVIGILLALLAREINGEGQHVDISMTDSLMALLPLAAGLYWTTGKAPERGDSIFSHRYAFYNVYETADGKYVCLGALERRFWKNLCEYFQVPEYLELQFDETRREEIRNFFKKAFMKKTRDEWTDIFSKIEICLSGVMELDEVLNSRYARQRDMVLIDGSADDGKPLGLGFAAKLGGTPARVRSLPPKFGEHTVDILAELGYSSEQIEKLREDEVI